MKKIILLLAVLVLLVGCAEKPTQPTEPATTQEVGGAEVGVGIEEAPTEPAVQEPAPTEPTE